MNQSSFIAAILLAAFILFLAAKGRLNVYANVLWGASPSSAPPPPSNAQKAASTMINNPGNNIFSQIGSFLGSAATFGLGQ